MTQRELIAMNEIDKDALMCNKLKELEKLEVQKQQEGGKA